MASSLQQLNAKPADYLIVNSHRCVKTTPWVLIFVLSSSDNVEQREAIRLTWADKSQHSATKPILVLFMLGRVPDTLHADGTPQRFIDDENNEFSDIIQDGSFMDDDEDEVSKVCMFKFITFMS